MKIEIGELQQIARFWNEAIMEKRKADFSMGTGAGIIFITLTIIGLFSLGKYASIAHTLVPSLFGIYGAILIFRGVACNNKSKAAHQKIDNFGKEKAELFRQTLDSMTGIIVERHDDTFKFREVRGKGRGNEKVLDWKGRFNGDLVTLIKEPRDEIYFLLIDELNIEAGKALTYHSDDRIMDVSRPGMYSLDTINEKEEDITRKDRHARFKFMDRDFTGEIPSVSLQRYEKWKKGEYPQTTENGEPVALSSEY